MKIRQAKKILNMMERGNKYKNKLEFSCISQRFLLPLQM